MQLYISDLKFNVIIIVNEVNKKRFVIRILILLNLTFYFYSKWKDLKFK